MIILNNIQAASLNKKNISFCSNREHEAMLRALREAQARELQRKYDDIKSLYNYEIKDQGCHNMAQFLLNFVCAIENDSEHSLDEFFKSEVEAAQIRKNLSPECQRNSLEIRKEIQSQPVFKDPVLTLITAKDMKDFVPDDEEFAKNEEYQLTIQAAKKSIIDSVESADKTKFVLEELGMIKTLTQIIQKTKGLDMGEEYNSTLEKLINSINKRKQKIEETAVKQRIINPQLVKKIKI